MIDVKRFDSEEGNVFKYVFHFEDAIAESVLYRYGSFLERTVMCVSVQSGCPVGCTFCGTGKNFIKNLTSSEICEQVDYLIGAVEFVEGLGKDYNNQSLDSSCKKLQIMFMSMGEPMLNWNEVNNAIIYLNKKYKNAQLLISTVGIDDEDVLFKILTLSSQIKKIGLQFSIHDAFEDDRNLIIPFKNKLSLREIRNYGLYWSIVTGRPIYLNYCVTEESGKKEKLERLMDIFDPEHFHITFSTVCEIEKDKKSCDNLVQIKEIYEMFLSKGYNARIFDAAGKDDIGAGCGQLWYVQEWMKNNM